VAQRRRARSIEPGAFARVGDGEVQPLEQQALVDIRDLTRRDTLRLASRAITATRRGSQPPRLRKPAILARRGRLRSGGLSDLGAASRKHPNDCRESSHDHRRCAAAESRDHGYTSIVPDRSLTDAAPIGFGMGADHRHHAPRAASGTARARAGAGVLLAVGDVVLVGLAVEVVDVGAEALLVGAVAAVEPVVVVAALQRLVVASAA
jgi:hypothetical protein